MKKRARTGLVLSGGAARGLAHLGVLSGLEDAGIPVDLIVGASFGSIAGAYYACGYTPTQMRQKAGEFSLLKVLGPGLPPHLLSSRRLEKYLARYLPGSFQDLAVPLRIAATDIQNREIIFLDQGPLLPAILASSAFPGLLPPVRFQKRLLVDGGFSNDMLVREACLQGAEVVIFSDVDLITGLRRRKWAVWLYEKARKRALAGPPPSFKGTPGLVKTALAVLRTLEEVRPGDGQVVAADCHMRPLKTRYPALRFGGVEQAFLMGCENVKEASSELRALVWG